MGFSSRFTHEKKKNTNNDVTSFGLATDRKGSFASNLTSLRFNENTLPKTNIVPKNRPSQKESSLPITNFQGIC